MKDKNTLDLGTIDELEDRHDIPLAKVKKLMETRPIIREKGEEFTLLSIPMEIEFKALLDNLDVEFRRRVIEGIPGITFPSKSGNVFAFISKVGRTNTAFDLGIISRRLNVKRIINLGTAGSLSDNVHSFDVVIANNVAYYDVDLTAFDYLILKQRQVLISIRPKDFSFVLDESLPEIFSVFNQYRQKINLIQSSAVNLSLCVDDSRYLERVVDTLQTGFRVVYNKGMELLTVRGYDDASYRRFAGAEGVYLVQKTRRTMRVVRLAGSSGVSAVVAK